MQLKYFLLFIALPVFSIGVKAQNVPNLNEVSNSGIFSDMALPPEVSIGTGGTNVVRTYTPIVPITDASTFNSASPATIARQQVVYLDGFQRPAQSINKNVSNVNGVVKHLVQVYDSRPLTTQYSFLPFTSTNENLNTNAFSAQKAYYQTLFPEEGYSSFSKTESSSGSGERSVTTYAPGKAQVGLEYGSVSKLLTNPASQVIIWDIDANGTPIANGYYAAGVLTGTEVAGPDANGSNVNVGSPRTRSYTDKDGKTILKMVADSSYSVSTGNQVSAGITYTYTYYVYDGKGNLRCTIPPKAFKYYQQQGSISSTILNNLCFQYQYDSKGRISGMKKPGEDDYTYIVYDRKDRPVMRQKPSEREAYEWEISFLDGLGRTKVTSVYTDEQGIDRNAWQNEIDSWTSSGPYADLLNYLITPAMESEYPVGNHPITDPDNDAYSLIANNNVMTISYYDDYTKSYYNDPQDLDPTRTLFTGISNQAALPLLVNAPGAEVPDMGRAYGMKTGTIVRVLRSPNATSPDRVGDWRSSVYFYDDKGRSVYTQNVVTNSVNGGTVIANDYAGIQYDFAGRVLVAGHTMINQISQDNSLGAQHSEYTQNQYDNYSGALIKTVHKVDDGEWVTLSKYLYDDMGRLARKTLGNGGEVQQMTYNIRGQLAGINGEYAETAQKDGFSKTFGESLKYDYGFSKPRYDSKIAGMVWRGSSAADMYAYGYDYTQDGALKRADFNHQEGGNWAHSTMDYSVSNVFYDKNGNMTDMKQRGVIPGTGPGSGPVDMDNLHYIYEDGGISNRLAQVNEQSTVGNYNAGDFQGPSATSSYDANGNLSSNAGYKNIHSITYTRFNKPLVISFQNGSSIEYSYDATGNKVEELTIDVVNGITKRIDYIGNAVYQNTFPTATPPSNKADSLQYLLTGEGRTTFNFSTKKPSEEFFVRDHLGNIRSVINVSGYELHQYYASYEIASAHLESLIFDNIDAVRDVKPGGEGDDKMAANLNGGDPSRTIGTSILLHVMAGDKVDLNVSTFYSSYDARNDGPLGPDAVLSQVISTLTGGVGGLGSSESHDTKMVQSLFTPGNYSNYNNILNSITDDSKPKAYLNYILFDENMKMTGQMSGAFQASGDGSWAEIGTTSAMEVPVNGYLAVYISNSTVSRSCIPCADVYFDRMIVNISHGNLLEENHYYPHGLPIFNLGSRRSDANYNSNRQKYQSNEYITDQGLNWMSFGARQYDPQIGRFLSVDPLAAFDGQDKYSPYVAMGNQPESSVDPNGMSPMLSGPSGTRLNSIIAADGGSPGGFAGAGANGGWGGGAPLGGSVSGGATFDFSRAATVAYWSNAKNSFNSMTGNKATLDEKGRIKSESPVNLAGGSPTAQEFTGVPASPQAQNASQSQAFQFDPSAGGVISNDADFYRYMVGQANNNPVEVSAWKIQDNETNTVYYFVLPWDGNAWDRSVWDVDAYTRAGYNWNNKAILSDYHTHSTSTGPSYEDLIHRQKDSYPTYTIGADGRIWNTFNPPIGPQVRYANMPGQDPNVHRYGEVIPNPF